MTDYGMCPRCWWWNEDYGSCENPDGIFCGRYTLTGCEDWEDMDERSKED